MHPAHRAPRVALPRRTLAAKRCTVISGAATLRPIGGPGCDAFGERRVDMEVFVQQLINGITLGSIYGLIAIGYTMVFGIIGMVNFAHGDVFMVSTFVALITVLVLSTVLGISSIFLTLFIVLIVGMLVTSLLSWAIERVAYRPLRGSFRLAPLISAIGMSIFLMNFVQVAQGPRNKSIPPMVTDVFVLMDRGNYTVTLSYRQIDHLERDSGPAGRLLVSRGEDLARARTTRLRAGSEDGLAARRRCRPHHLASPS